MTLTLSAPIKFCISLAVVGAIYTTPSMAASESDQLHEIGHMFEGANIISGPSMVDCTLSGGTASRCFTITVKAEPLDYTPGPWCPQNVSDGADVGGIWLDNGKVYDVDGAFIENLASFYDDTNWMLYDEASGKINVTDTKVKCDAAARPDVDPEYQNHCVQCLPEYMDDDAAVTYVIPVSPVALGNDSTNSDTGGSGSGVAFNGIRLDGPAPVDAILSAYTVAPFDDCGGHVNLNVGYHYHVATDCLLQQGQDNDHGTVVGMAMDGHKLYTQVDATSDSHTDLDACGGHSVMGEYHYHAGEQGSNAILSCFVAEVGCVLEGTGTECDASVSTRGGGGAGGGAGGGGKPDFASVAEKLGVSESALMGALGGPPPNLENAAKVLNIDIDTLREAMPKR